MAKVTDFHSIYWMVETGTFREKYGIGCEDPIVVMTKDEYDAMLRGRIVLEVRGGITEVAEKPVGIEIVVVDWDNVDPMAPGAGGVEIVSSTQDIAAVSAKTAEQIALFQDL